MIKRNDGISKDDICQNQFTAYVVLAVKRKRQSYIKKKQRDNEKENRTKKEAEQSEFRTAGYDMWSRMEPQNEKLMAAMQQLSLKERFVVTVSQKIFVPDKQFLKSRCTSQFSRE